MRIDVVWNINLEKVERRQKVDNFGRLLHLCFLYVYIPCKHFFFIYIRKIWSDGRNIFSCYRDERGGREKRARKQIAWYERIITPKLSHERNNQLQELSHNEYNALRKVVRTHGKKTSKKHDVFLDKVDKKKISNSFNNKWKTKRCNRFIFEKIPICFIRNADFSFSFLN